MVGVGLFVTERELVGFEDRDLVVGLVNGEVRSWIHVGDLCIPEKEVGGDNQVSA
jgi:hypothetical protein